MSFAIFTGPHARKEKTWIEKGLRPLYSDTIRITRKEGKDLNWKGITTLINAGICKYPIMKEKTWIEKGLRLYRSFSFLNSSMTEGKDLNWKGITTKITAIRHPSGQVRRKRPELKRDYDVTARSTIPTTLNSEGKDLNWKGITTISSSPSMSFAKRLEGKAGLT